MADNVAVTEGAGKTIATDDVGGAQYQHVKVNIGADGVGTILVGGAGAVAAGVLRTTLASDDPAVASLSVLDDWDETNRCAVNLIASQVGIAGGAGAVGATVPRVTLASDDPLVTLQTGIAHDSADSGNPHKIGAKAIATLSGATLVAAADRTDIYADLDGALISRGGYCLGDVVSGNASNTDGTSTQVLAAGAAGVKHYITDITLTNMSSSSIYVELKDDTTVKWTCPLPANSGFTKSFATPLAGTAATAWNFDPSAAATTVYCSVSGFKSKV